MCQNIVCTFANNIDQDQTALLGNGVEQGQIAPFGAVCLWSSLFSQVVRAQGSLQYK